MSTFWLNDFTQLYKIDLDPNNLLNTLSSLLIISLVIITFKTKDSKYFVILVGLLLIIIAFYYLNKDKSSFDPTISNTYNTGIYLIKDTDNNNALYVNQASGFNKGDILALSVNGNITETGIVSDIQYTTNPGVSGSPIPVILLLTPLKNSYKANTLVMKVSSSSPNIVAPPDANVSIQNSNGYISDPFEMAVQDYPKYNLPNLNRYDWNLELSTYGGLQPGQPPNYKYDGQPNGPLVCRTSTTENPMGTINVTEYDEAPTMYGTCNVQENNNDYLMTTNQESTVSQRVEDLLFHKGNSQAQYSPVPVDTLPNDQEAFAHFCYRSPTNLVNPKYSSIFVNDPDKYKLVAKLARATGTENGGGGGGH
jgi:hypothetical protein